MGAQQLTHSRSEGTAGAQGFLQGRQFCPGPFLPAIYIPVEQLSSECTQPPPEKRAQPCQRAQYPGWAPVTSIPQPSLEASPGDSLARV